MNYQETLESYQKQLQGLQVRREVLKKQIAESLKSLGILGEDPEGQLMELKAKLDKEKEEITKTIQELEAKLSPETQVKDGFE